jgi:hypothetical protein
LKKKCGGLLVCYLFWRYGHKSLIVSRVTKGAQLDDIISGLWIICQFRVYRRKQFSPRREGKNGADASLY